MMLSRLFFHWENYLSKRDTNRTVRPFEWGLEFISDMPRSGKGALSPDLEPKEFLLEYAKQAVAESDRYHCYEPVRDFRLEGRHLRYTSPLPTIYPENNTVLGRYFPVDSKGRVVLVLPQWNSDAGGHISLCRMLNYYGLSALRLSLPYHDARMPEGMLRADYMLSSNIGRTLQAVRQAVVDTRAAIDWLQSRGYYKFAILGTSVGSCVAFITVAHDTRIETAVQNHVSPYFADVVWRGISTRHVRAGLEGHISIEDLRNIWMPISPKAYFRKIAGTAKKTLLVHALYDYTFLPELSAEVLEDYRKLRLIHSTLALRCGHYTSGVFPFNVILGCAMCWYIRKNL
ncbi:MAG TPA: abhydrolase domain-containing 18 [Acidobacteriota bacterium]|nr:abhydrolase domain-containing 18 [Acidobacteriota bacterium]